TVMADRSTNVAVTDALATRLERLVGGLGGTRHATAWTGYHERGHYDGGALGEKDRFVQEALAEANPRGVLDLGCNDGRYARLAAEHAEVVVALDADRQVVDALYRSLRGGSGSIIPLVGDLADPSPALGWALAERMPLHERVEPDVVLSLALIHHLV